MRICWTVRDAILRIIQFRPFWICVHDYVQHRHITMKRMHAKFAICDTLSRMSKMSRIFFSFSNIEFFLSRVSYRFILDILDRY